MTGRPRLPLSLRRPAPTRTAVAFAVNATCGLVAPAKLIGYVAGLCGNGLQASPLAANMGDAQFPPFARVAKGVSPRRDKPNRLANGKHNFGHDAFPWAVSNSMNKSRKL